MAKVTYKIGIASAVTASAVTNGRISVATDTQMMYVDSGTTRIPITDVVTVALYSDLAGILAPLSNKFYYVTEKNTLYKYISSAWSPVGSGVFLTAHPTINVSSTTTTSVSLASGTQFTVIKDITLGTNGHVTKLYKETYTMPTLSAGGADMTIATYNAAVALSANDIIIFDPADSLWYKVTDLDHHFAYFSGVIIAVTESSVAQGAVVTAKVFGITTPTLGEGTIVVGKALYLPVIIYSNGKFAITSSMTTELESIGQSYIRIGKVIVSGKVLFDLNQDVINNNGDVDEYASRDAYLGDGWLGYSYLFS